MYYSSCYFAHEGIFQVPVFRNTFFVSGLCFFASFSLRTCFWTAWKHLKSKSKQKEEFLKTEEFNLKSKIGIMFEFSQNRSQNRNRCSV